MAEGGREAGGGRSLECAYLCVQKVSKHEPQWARMAETQESAGTAGLLVQWLVGVDQEWSSGNALQVWQADPELCNRNAAVNRGSIDNQDPVIGRQGSQLLQGHQLCR